MKTTTTLLLATSIAGGMLLMGCSNTAENQADKMESKMGKVQDDLNSAAEAETLAAYERERSDALDKLYDMRNNIDQELVTVNERLATEEMKADKRAEQEALKVEIEDQQEEVGRLIANVEGSTQGTWISVKEDTRSAAEKVEDWWNRTKENVKDLTKSGKDHN